MAPELPEGESPVQRSSWMVTFADLLALLLAFFVLLFSMSSIERQSWDAMVAALANRLNPARAPLGTLDRPDGADDARMRGAAIDLTYLATVLRQKTEGAALLSASRLWRFPDRLVLFLPAGLIFEPDGSAITPRAREAVETLGDVLRFAGNQVDVEGHAEAIVAGRPAEPDWEFALARAAALARLLETTGYPGEIGVYGRGDGVVSLPQALTADERASLAQRVDIVIRATGGSGDEAR